uniref:Integrase, catalytic region, zinc finger, CCHC-type, peptidase aspartic, catalytic n=1 Tax=Tanacetum cinerariifolium TaxID=118510 RepID=A0A6L2K388_TANCI|nr:hypothetical protein [Tanacetum cinerariifolium]
MLETINQIVNLLSGFQKQFSPTNNQLKTSTNPMTQATIQAGQITTESVQRRALRNKEAKSFLADVECTTHYDDSLAITPTTTFEVSHKDSYDFDVDEAPHAAAAFMANLAGTSTGEGTSNDIDFHSEVHTHNNHFFENVNHQVTLVMHQEEQLDFNVDSNIDDYDNIIPYHQYQSNTKVENVPTKKTWCLAQCGVKNRESAPAEEPMQTNQDLEEPSHQEFETGAADDQPIAEASQHPEWFQQQKKPPIPDHDWNKTLPATYESIQPWISDLAKQADSRSSFNELMDTPVDFLAFLMNRLKVDTLTPELLAGPTYELMKGSCKSLVELKFFLEEVNKPTTDQLDWNNPEGQQYPHNLLKPLPLIPNSRGRRVILFDHFINNDLEIKNDSLKDENVLIKACFQGLYKSKAGSNSSVSSRETIPVKPKAIASGLYATTPKYVPPQNTINRETNSSLPGKVTVTVVNLSNVPVNLPTGIKYVPYANKFKSKSDKKIHKNLPARSKNVNRVVKPPRNLNKKNHVDSSLNDKRTGFISKSISVCKTCNECLVFDNHDDCVFKYVNAKKPKVINNVNMKQVWKVTSKVFASVGSQWKATGRKFTLGDMCPLTRITKPEVVSLENFGSWKATGRKFTLGDMCPLTRITKPEVVSLENFGSVRTSEPTNNITVTPRFFEKTLTSCKHKDRNTKDTSISSPSNIETMAAKYPVIVCPLPV